jgi:nucleoside-diphosphate-sugar epimerase
MLRQDHDVRVLDRAPGRECLHVDLEACDEAPFEGAEAVIHLAAHADVRQNWTEPGRFAAGIARDNMAALVRTLENAARVGVDRFVFVSTGAVYAGHRGGPGVPRRAEETDACVATSPYAASKLSGESFVHAYAEKHGWKRYIARPAACFGFGYHHGHVADFVHMADHDGVIRALDNGNHVRDAVHVRDVARALVAMATAPVDGDAAMRPGVYNIASEEGWSWPDTISLMGDIPFEPGKSENGWVGDSRGVRMSTARIDGTMYAPKYSVRDGVCEALESLGWKGGDSMYARALGSAR